LPTVLQRETLLRHIVPVVALILAVNYFSFRTEIFRGEMEANDDVADILGEFGSVSETSLNWETFDKDNAPKAFVCTPMLPMQILYVVAPIRFSRHPLLTFSHPVRDKSPPVSPLLLNS